MTTAKPKGRPKSADSKPSRIGGRCSLAYQAWANGFADKLMTDQIGLIEAGLAALALIHKHEPPPPR